VPTEHNSLDIAGAINKEIEIRTVFRYANVFDRALNLIASGQVDLKPRISDTGAFEDAIKGFERAASGLPTDGKLQLRLAY
ncbi:MAG: sulfurtransferase, partial [Tardiphaga sp.]|nr:sulfurtransferase [Tardiphaga sp.]